MAWLRTVSAMMIAGLAAGATLFGSAAPADAGARYRVENGQMVYKGGGARVKPRISRRGGYSYDQFDSINTYGDSRGRYGSATSLRDPQLGRQTEAGPFDHGFFFDSGVGLRGGDAPYNH